MAWSIFHSNATWEKNTSKSVERTDVDTEDELNEIAHRVLRKGGKINGILENYQDIVDETTAPSRRRHGR